MRNKILKLYVFTFLCVLLSSCQSNNNQIQDTIQPTPNTNLLLYAEPSLVSVSVAELAKSYVITFDDEESLIMFNNLFTKAVKRDGIANMAKPEYLLKIVNEEGTMENLYLWLGEKGQKSILMNENDTHTTYSISEDLTDFLIILLAKQAEFNVFDAREVKIGDTINDLTISKIDVTPVSPNDYYATVSFDGELLLSGELMIKDLELIPSEEGWGLGNYFQPDEHSSTEVPTLHYERSRTGFTLIDNAAKQLEQLSPGTYNVTIKVSHYEIWSIGKGQENKATLVEILNDLNINE